MRSFISTPRGDEVAILVVFLLPAHLTS